MRQDLRVAVTAAAAALGTAGGALALWGLGVPFAVGALALAVGAGLIVRAALSAAPAADATRLAVLEAAVSTLRHDLRGALSPALMVTDRLLASPDPAIARAGQAVIRSITRASDLLDATKAAPRPTPPARP